jgi:hypothetical protein
MFLIVKGSSSQASIDTTSYFRLTEPGLPAFVLVAAAIAYLVPSRRARPERAAPRPIPRWATALTAASGALVPLVLVLALRAQSSAARSVAYSTEAPISSALTATVSAGRLTWRPVAGHGSRVQYVVYRVDPDSGGCTFPPSGSHECLFDGTTVGVTRATSFDVPSGATYRVAAAANYLDEQNGGDLILLGPPVASP